MDTKQKAVLVTGASTGIGRQCVLDMAEDGYLVFATVRTRYEPFPSTLPIITIPLDITDDEQMKAAVWLIEKSLREKQIKGLFALFNNAGIAVGGPLEFVPIQDFQHQFDINVLGQVRCIQAFLPLLREYGRGARILNMSSIAGRSYLPFSSPYCASKHAFEAISDSLRIELLPWGIHVCLLEPGLIKTPIWDKASKALNHYVSSYPEEAQLLYGKYLSFFARHITSCAQKAIAPNIISQSILTILNSRKPKHRYLYGKDAKLRALLNLLPTSILDRLISGYLSKHISDIT